MTERPSELRAAAIVAALTSCTPRRLDLGDGRQAPDFALDVGGRQIGVLEVTSISDRAVNSFFSAKSKKHRTWEDPRLSRDWRVWVDGPTWRLQDMRRPLEAVLLELEASGIEFTSARQVYVEPVHPLPPGLDELGIVEVRAVGPERPEGGRVFINLMPVGGSYGVSSVTAAVEGALYLDDNREKLSGQLERRELFVWLDGFAASALITFSQLPFAEALKESPPHLPPEATAVWTAVWSNDASRFVGAVWRGDREGWRAHATPGPPQPCCGEERGLRSCAARADAGAGGSPGAQRAAAPDWFRVIGSPLG